MKGTLFHMHIGANEEGQQTPLDGSPVDPAAEAIDLNWRESLKCLPIAFSAMHLTRELVKVKKSIAEVMRTAKSESLEDPTGVGLPVGIGLAAQAVSRTFRPTALLVPEAATRAYEQTNSTFIAALAGGGAFAAWNGFVGQSAATMIDRSPRTMEATQEEFPTIVDFFVGTTETETGRSPENKSTGSKLKRFGRRALAGVGLGPTMYVGSEMASSGSLMKASVTNAEVTLGASAVVGGIVFTAMEGLERVAENGHPELAQDMLSVLSNGQLWQAVGFGIAYSSWKASKKEAPEALNEGSDA